MNNELSNYQAPERFNRFVWHKFADQNESNITYLYLATPPVSRLQGESSVLYVGKTEGALSKRIRDELESRNSPRKTQNTNVRLSAVAKILRSKGYIIIVYFTVGLETHLESDEVVKFSEALDIWEKSYLVNDFKPNDDGTADVSIEKYLLVHYALTHLELPPFNNAMGSKSRTKRGEEA